MLLKVTVFSFLALLLLAPNALAQCEFSPGFDHSVTMMQGDLEIAFATNGSVFALDETVQFELIVKNAGAAATVISWATQPPERFQVTAPDCANIFDCLETSLFTHPSIYMYVPGEETLGPDACRKYAASWDLATDPAPVGPYKAWGGLFEVNVDTWPTPPGFWLYPATGAELLIEIQETVANEAASWGLVKTLYR